MEEQVRGMLFMEQENDSLDDGAEKTYRRRPELILLFLKSSGGHTIPCLTTLKSDSTYTPSSSTSSSKEIEHHKSYAQKLMNPN